MNSFENDPFEHYEGYAKPKVKSRPRFLIRHGIPYYMVDLYRLDVDEMFPPCQHHTVQGALECIIKHNRCLNFDVEIQTVVEKFYRSDGEAVPKIHEF